MASLPRGPWRWAAVLLGAAGTLAAAEASLEPVAPAAAGGVAPVLPTAQVDWGARTLKDDLPLHTQGRYIVGKSGERVKWACVNWYGAHSGTFVPGGLEVKPLTEIVSKIAMLGFNCVRLPYSTEAQLSNPLVEKQFVKANPQFWGARFFDVFDATVEALSSAGIMVIPNNQNHKAGWCCYFKQNEGLWHVPGYSADVWVDGLVNMTRRYRDTPMVVAMDLRNEVHDFKPTTVTWGTGSKATDWAAAATRAGNAVLDANPNVLIVVSGICFGMEIRPAKKHPIQLSKEHRVVYEAHNYLEFNIFNVFSEVVMPWWNVQWITAVLCVLSIGSLAVIWRMWKSLGRPIPPLEVIIVTASAWMTFLCLLGAVMSMASAWGLTQLPACGYWAHHDVYPFTVTFLVLAVLGMLVFAVSCFCPRRLQHGSARYLGGRPSSATLPEGSPAAAAAECAAPAAADSDSESEDEDSPEDASSASRRGRLCAPGYASSRLAVGRCLKQRAWEKEDAPPREVQVWDQGLCVGLQCCILAIALLVGMALFFAFATIAPTYPMMRWHLHNSWGFLLEEGHPYTAPVWLGEFGATVRGHYWENFMQYLNDFDVDWAFWAINGRKWTTGWIDTMHGGRWIPTEGHWTNEQFGILDADYETVREAWLMLDLRAIQASPAQWRPRFPACSRRLLGTACGG